MHFLSLVYNYVFIFSDLLKLSESEMASNKDEPYHMCSICLSDIEAIVKAILIMMTHLFSSRSALISFTKVVLK